MLYGLPWAKARGSGTPSKPHGSLFILSGKDHNGGLGQGSRSLAHSHRRPPSSWAPFTSHTDSNLGPPPLRYSRWLSDLTGSRGWGHSRRLWNTWWRNPGPPLTKIPQERKEERKEEPGRKGPDLHIITHRWEPIPKPMTDPAGFQLQSERKAPIKHGLGRDVGTEIRNLENHLRKLALGRQQQDLIPDPGCLVNTLSHPRTPLGSLGSSGVPATGR